MRNDKPKLLNIGCGSTFHPEWINIDLTSSDPSVIEHDLTSGLPVDSDSCDAVYHSHVLEHLTPDAASKLLRECRRVLKPQGVLRIAVPDLEQIARTYLQSCEEAAKNPSDVTNANHHWMQLELIDQLVRCESGGEMGRYMSQAEIVNEYFVRQRMGDEFLRGSNSPTAIKRPGWIVRKATRFRDKLVRAILNTCYGQQTWSHLQEARFRNQGEIHRWMYDRVSLRRLLIDTGFENASVRTCNESQIPGFSSYALDANFKQARKPDSLFVEATKASAVCQKLNRAA